VRSLQTTLTPPFPRSPSGVESHCAKQRRRRPRKKRPYKRRKHFTRRKVDDKKGSEQKEVRLVGGCNSRTKTKGAESANETLQEQTDISNAEGNESRSKLESAKESKKEDMERSREKTRWNYNVTIGGKPKTGDSRSEAERSTAMSNR
jgi:hypothetical protein